MGCLSKIVAGTVLAFVLLALGIVGLWAGAIYGLPALLDWQLRTATGFGLGIDGMKFDVATSSFSARGVRLENPREWPSAGSVLTVGEILIDIEPRSVRGEELVFDEVALHLEEVHLSFNANGISNLAELQTRIRELNLPTDPAARPYRIQKLRIKADRVRQTTVSPEGIPQEHIIPLDIELELENVTDIEAVKGALLRTLFRGGLMR